MTTKKQAPLPKILGYRVLVKLDNPLEEGSEIHIPAGVQTTVDRTQGVIVAVGDGQLPHPNQDKRAEIQPKVGDRVWMSDMVQPVIIDGLAYAVAAADDVFAILLEGMHIARP